MKGSKAYSFLIINLLIVIISYNCAWAQSTNIDDKEGIKRVLTGLSDAWEKAVGSAWGSYFTEDADFTVWFGLRLKGRNEIAEGHQWVFDTVYPNTRIEFEITDYKILSPDIAIAHLDASVIEPGETLPDEPQMFPVAVFQKIDEEWKIVMFHNMLNRIKEIEERQAKGDMGDVRNEHE